MPCRLRSLSCKNPACGFSEVPSPIQACHRVHRLCALCVGGDSKILKRVCSLNKTKQNTPSCCPFLVDKSQTGRKYWQVARVTRELPPEFGKDCIKKSTIREKQPCGNVGERFDQRGAARHISQGKDGEPPPAWSGPPDFSLSRRRAGRRLRGCPSDRTRGQWRRNPLDEFT